ncbi:MAG: DNA-processing protein DprA [Candidatus Hydrogenedens sp.]|nr:DNA-processing protein DprA [Candidatus Hydrogenedens sp.]
MQNDQIKQWLNLYLIPGIGSATFLKLIARFGAPSEVLSASEKALAEVVGKTISHRIAQYREVVDLDNELRLIDKHNVTIITLDDPEYPLSLAEIYEPPLVLYCKGKLLEKDLRSIAIVGTRKISPYGTKVTEIFARGLSQAGFTIVSGFALGVDGIAHKTAIANGGRTVAFLGCGIDIIYPAQHQELWQQIQSQGAIISTFPMGTKPTGNNFPVRNRFISGFSLGTLVTEAPLNSGAMITAQYAVDQGKTVFAVPGPIGYANSQGSHSLIRQGAKLVEHISDILEEIPQLWKPETLSEPLQMPLASAIDIDKPDTTKSNNEIQQKETKQVIKNKNEQPAGRSYPSPMNEKEKAIIDILNPQGSYVDEVALACHIPVSEALSMLTIMEMKGLVKQFPGKKFAKA